MHQIAPKPMRVFGVERVGVQLRHQVKFRTDIVQHPGAQILSRMPACDRFTVLKRRGRVGYGPGNIGDCGGFCHAALLEVDVWTVLSHLIRTEPHPVHHHEAATRDV